MGWKEELRDGPGPSDSSLPQLSWAPVASLSLATHTHVEAHSLHKDSPRAEPTSDKK